MENLIYFQDWWSLGDNCVVEKINGVLSDDQNVQDGFITSQMEFDKFKENIAESVYVKGEVDKKYTLKKNLGDSLLGNKMEVDFNSNIVFVCTGAIVKEVLFSKIFQCYLVTFSEKRVEKSMYCAVVVNKFKVNETESITTAFQLMNAKPEMLVTDRPKFENNEY